MTDEPVQAEQQEQQPSSDQHGSDQPSAGASFDQPGKLLRIAMMVREMLEEVRRAPLDVDAREHLGEIHRRVVAELKSGLSDALSEELERMITPFTDKEVPTEAELRIAQAQLLGWLEGLFQGIQAAIATQQLTMAAQLEEMRRRSLPAGMPGAPDAVEHTPGQYL
jgi:hypothetical protein